MLSVFQRLDPSRAQWDLNSQHTYMDGPYVVSLDRMFNGKIHVYCANGVKTLVAFYDGRMGIRRTYSCKPLSPHGDI